jgi:hypothetical protein
MAGGMHFCSYLRLYLFRIVHVIWTARGSVDESVSMFWSDLRQSFGITSCCSLDTQSAYSDVYLENSEEVLPKFCLDRIGAWKLTNIRIREGSGQLCSATLGKICLAWVFPGLSSVVARDPREPISVGRATSVPPPAASDRRTSAKHRATPKPCAGRCTVACPPRRARSSHQHLGGRAPPGSPGGRHPVQIWPHGVCR